jgi:hypothetical protein
MTVNEVERASHYSAIRTGQGYGCMLQINGPYTFLGVRFSLVKFCFDDETLLESVDLLASVTAYGAIERRVLSKQWQGEFCRCSIDVVGGKQCDGGVDHVERFRHNTGRKRANQ